VKAPLTEAAGRAKMPGGHNDERASCFRTALRLAATAEAKPDREEVVAWHLMEHRCLWEVM
jgi:hypothetical protein